MDLGRPTIRIGPRATLRHTFTVDAAPPDGGGAGMSSGIYRVIASFGRREAAPLQPTVVP